MLQTWHLKQDLCQIWKTRVGDRRPCANVTILKIVSPIKLAKIAIFNKNDYFYAKN
jgi:hypothetical protein